MAPDGSASQAIIWSYSEKSVAAAASAVSCLFVLLACLPACLPAACLLPACLLVWLPKSGAQQSSQSQSR